MIEGPESFFLSIKFDLCLGLRASKSMPQASTMRKVLKDESEFNQIKGNNEVRLAKSCMECNLKKYEEKRRALELTYQHQWTREDGSKITDP